MSYYPIRYEYADAESSNSQHSMPSADPPLFKQQMEEEHFHQQQQQFLLECNGSSVMPLTPFNGQQQQQMENNESDYWHPRIEEEESLLQHPHQQTFAAQHQQQEKPAKRGVKMEFLQHQQPFFDDINDDEQENVGLSDHPVKYAALDHHQHQQMREPFQRLRHLENTPPREQKSLLFHGHESGGRKGGEGNSTYHGPPSEHWEFHECEQQHQQLNLSELHQKQQEHHGYNNSNNNCHQSSSFSPFEHRHPRGDHRQLVIVGGPDETGHEGSVDEELAAEDGMDESAAEQDAKGQLQIAPNGFSKPAYSYSCLIGLSLKNSSSGELTVSEIYAFLCHHFPYFREAPSGWKNSVRHNLSLNKCFKKIEVETPGSHGRKSCLWTLNPARRCKMDQELKKWRERNESLILSAMEHPETLDAIQNGQVGMPPGMKQRRFMISRDDGLLVVRKQQQTPHQPSRRLASSSGGTYTSSAAIDHQVPPRSFHSSHQNQRHFYQQQHHQSPQQQRREIIPPHGNGSNQNSRNESMHALAKRKLEDLLQRQKSATNMEPEQIVDPYTGLLLSQDGGSAKQRKRRSSDAVSDASSGHSSRRNSRHSNEHNISNTEGGNTHQIYQQRETAPPSFLLEQSQNIHRHQQMNGQQQQPPGLQVERRRREAAMAIFYQNLKGVKAERMMQGTPKSNTESQITKDQLRSMLGPNSHRPLLHQHLAICTERTLQPSSSNYEPHSISHQLISPFTRNTTNCLGLDSCERALIDNPLLDCSQQLSRSPKMEATDTECEH